MKLALGVALVISSIIVYIMGLYEDGISWSSLFASIITVALFGGAGCLLCCNALKED